MNFKYTVDRIKENIKIKQEKVKLNYYKSTHERLAYPQLSFNYFDHPDERRYAADTIDEKDFANRQAVENRTADIKYALSISNVEAAKFEQADAPAVQPRLFEPADPKQPVFMESFNDPKLTSIKTYDSIDDMLQDPSVAQSIKNGEREIYTFQKDKQLDDYFAIPMNRIGSPVNQAVLEYNRELLPAAQWVDNTVLGLADSRLRQYQDVNPAHQAILHDAESLVPHLDRRNLEFDLYNEYQTVTDNRDEKAQAMYTIMSNYAREVDVTKDSITDDMNQFTYTDNQDDIKAIRELLHKGYQLHQQAETAKAERVAVEQAQQEQNFRQQVSKRFTEINMERLDSKNLEQ